MRSLLLLGVFLSGSAVACGYCLEDKIAAAYDHGVITKAASQKHEVAFFHVDGTVPRQALEQAVYASGADRGTARIALEQQAVSFAYDPARAPLSSIHSKVEKRLASYKLTLMPLQVLK